MNLHDKLTSSEGEKLDISNVGAIKASYLISSAGTGNVVKEKGALDESIVRGVYILFRNTCEVMFQIRSGGITTQSSATPLN